MIGNEEKIEQAYDDVMELFRHNPFNQGSDFIEKENKGKIAYLNDRGTCFGIGIEYTRRAINDVDRPTQKSTITKLRNSHLKKDSNLARRISLYQNQAQAYLTLNEAKYSAQFNTTDLDSFFDELISRLNHSGVQALNSGSIEGDEGRGHTFIFRKDGDEYVIFDSNFGEFRTPDFFIDELKIAFEKMRVLYSLEGIDFTHVTLCDVKQLVEDLGITRKSRGTKDGSYKDPEIITIIDWTYESVKNIFDNSTPQEIQNLIFDEHGFALTRAIDKGDVKLVELFLSHMLNGDRELDERSIRLIMNCAFRAKQFDVVSAVLDMKWKTEDTAPITHFQFFSNVFSGNMTVDVFEKLINKFIDKGRFIYDNGASTTFLYSDNLNIAPYGATEKKDSPLMIVMNFCSDETIRKFIEAGADVNYVNSETQCSPLSYAIHMGRTEIIQMLVDNGIDVNKSFDMQDAETPPIVYAVFIGDLKSVDKLLSLGCKLGAEYSGVCFASAIGHENVEMISRLIELGMDVNVELNGGGTPLNKAIELGNFDITRKLIESGADISVLKKEDVKKAPIEIQKLISDHKDKLVEKEADSVEKKKLGHVDRLGAYHQGRIEEQRVEKPKKKDSHTARVTESKSTESVKSRQ
jgi:hypothetical protein